jgi:hypothetical protein
MSQYPEQGADASTNQGTRQSYDPQFEPLSHRMVGSLRAVQATIKVLHKRKYAEPNDWSRPVPTGQPNEVVVVLERRVRVA